VTAGEPLLTLHTDTPERFEAALDDLSGAFSIGADDAGADDFGGRGADFAPRPLILERVSA
jgi:thymidine phosphorylase